jgi:hypothetical protein
MQAAEFETRAESRDGQKAEPLSVLLKKLWTASLHTLLLLDTLHVSHHEMPPLKLDIELQLSIFLPTRSTTVSSTAVQYFLLLGQGSRGFFQSRLRDLSFLF